MVDLLQEGVGDFGGVAVADLVHRQLAHGHVRRLQQRQPLGRGTLTDGQVLEQHQGRRGQPEVGIDRAGEQPFELFLARRRDPLAQRLQCGGAHFRRIRRHDALPQHLLDPRIVERGQQAQHGRRGRRASGSFLLCTSCSSCSTKACRWAGVKLGTPAMRERTAASTTPASLSSSTATAAVSALAVPAAASAEAI